MTLLHHVDGQPYGEAAQTGAIFNPATGERTGDVAFATTAEVAHAIEIATAAQKAWAETGLVRRADVFFRMRQLLVERQDELGAIVTREHGKVLSDAKGEVSRGIENVEFAAGLTHLLKGEHSTGVAGGVDVHTIKAPVGVVACITPFNFPVMVPLWMSASALACGNAVILKPSEKDPSAANFIAALWEEAGLPKGLFNVIHGNKTAVDALLEAPGIGAVSFVGSTPIARYIYETAAKNGKRVQALGGAKNHMIVMPDADLDSAADAAIGAAYGAAGERCMAISVLVAVGDETADAVIAKVTERAAALRIGDGADTATDMGPLITREHRDRVASYVTGAQGEGAAVVMDGTTTRFDSDGFFLGASLIDNVKPGMKVYDDEIFGPVLSVVRAASYDEAVAIINANPYANGTAIFTRDGGTARAFRRTSKWAWWASTCLSRCRLARTRLAAGRTRSLAIPTSMGPSPSTSTRAPR